MENQLIGKIKIKYLPKRLNNTTPETSKKSATKNAGLHRKRIFEVQFLVTKNIIFIYFEIPFSKFWVLNIKKLFGELYLKRIPKYPCRLLKGFSTFLKYR